MFPTLFYYSIFNFIQFMLFTCLLCLYFKFFMLTLTHEFTLLNLFFSHKPRRRRSPKRQSSCGMSTRNTREKKKTNGKLFPPALVAWARAGEVRTLLTNNQTINNTNNNKILSNHHRLHQQFVCYQTSFILTT